MDRRRTVSLINNLIPFHRRRDIDVVVVQGEERRRDGPPQIVPVQMQVSQPREVAQALRQRARQAVAVEEELDDMAGRRSTGAVACACAVARANHIVVEAVVVIVVVLIYGIRVTDVAGAQHSLPALVAGVKHAMTDTSTAVAAITAYVISSRECPLGAVAIPSPLTALRGFKQIMQRLQFRHRQRQGRRRRPR